MWATLISILGAILQAALKIFGKSDQDKTNARVRELEDIALAEAKVRLEKLHAEGDTTDRATLDRLLREISSRTPR